MALKHSILVVEDDETLRDLLKYNLEKEGYAVFACSDGGTAIELYRSKKPSLVILDIMLPVLDGLEVCRIIRGESETPVIMLTAKAGEIDRVVGLEIGADDYITKPFSLRELLARIKAVTRRILPAKQLIDDNIADPTKLIKAGWLEIDISRHEVRRNGRTVDLNPKEFELLVMLVNNRNQVISRGQILQKIWGYEFIGGDRTVDVHVRWLRQKLEEDPANPQCLVTVRGYGYKWVSK
jgi:two-component system OmpR family response regulator